MYFAPLKNQLVKTEKKIVNLLANIVCKYWIVLKHEYLSLLMAAIRTFINCLLNVDRVD